MLSNWRFVKRGRAAIHPGVSAAVLIALVAWSPGVAAHPMALGDNSGFAQVAAQPSGAADPAGNDWPTYGGNLFNQRFSSLKQINTTNVAQLKGACTFHTTEHGVDRSLLEASGFESSPVVIDGTMYLSGPQSQVWALDATTCALKWEYVPEFLELPILPLCCGMVNRGVAVGNGKVFVAQLDARLVALDQNTGEVAWSVQVGDPRAGYSETLAPLFFNGMVIVGVSGAEYEIQGYVTAYDAATGSQKWRFFTTADAHGGASQWETAAVDPALGALYLPVGNPSPDVDGSNRPGNNPFTESIIALDLNDGHRKWDFQEIHHDIWDLDTVSPALLFDVTLRGQPVKALGQAGKTGWVYLLNRENGQPLVLDNGKTIVEQPVPQNGVQKTSATQPFVQGDSFVPNTNPAECSPPVTINGRTLAANPIFTPFDRDPVLMCPGPGGGSEWSPASFSPQTDLMYVCGIHQPAVFSRHPEQLQQAFLRAGSAFEPAPGAPTFGTFTAINVHTNTKAWQARLDQLCIGGSLATAGGLVFSGESNGNFDAYDAKTGMRLWQFQTGAGANAPAVTYSVGGQQFVAIAAGGNTGFGNYLFHVPRGDTLWVFSLNGTLGPAPAPAMGPSAVAEDRVEIEDYKFTPPNIRVPVGTTVEWRNRDDTAHTVTADAQQEAPPGQPVYPFDSGLMPDGADFSFTFNQAGKFGYHCNLHLMMGGTVEVVGSPAFNRLEASALGDAPELQAAVENTLALDAPRDTVRLPRATIDPTGDATVVVPLRNEDDVDPGVFSAMARSDVLAVLRAIYESPDAQRVTTATVLGTFPVQGSRGAARPKPVLRAVLTAERAATLGWDQLTPDQLPQLVDVWWWHPSLSAGTEPDEAMEGPRAGNRPPLTLPEARVQTNAMLVHLNEALAALSLGQEGVARSQLKQFIDKWDTAADVVRARAPEQFDTVDAEVERAEIALLHSVPEDIDMGRLALRALRTSLIEVARGLESD